MGKKDDNIILVPGCPLWMLTLGDCISLLVTFFVMLLSFSSPNSDQLADAIGGMKGALGMMNSGNAPSKAINFRKSTSSEGEEGGDAQDEGGKGSSMVSEEELAVVNLQNSRVMNRYNDFKQRLLEIGFSLHISSEQLNKGIFVSIPTEKLFLGGGVDFNVDAVKVVESFANLAGSVGNEVQLISSFSLPADKDDNEAWSLARNRSMAVGKLLRTKYNIHESRLTYGYQIIGKDQQAQLRLIIAEKIGISRISINELLNLSQNL